MENDMNRENNNKVIMVTKKCKMCGVERKLNEYYNYAKRRGGIDFSRCKECAKVAACKWNRANKIRRMEICIKSTAKNPYYTWARKSIYSHKHDGYDVNISVAQLELAARIMSRCPICDCLLDYSANKGQNALNGPSLDRIDNTNKITPQNSTIVCRTCNSIKNSRTFNEFLDYCKKVAKNLELRNI